MTKRIYKERRLKQIGEEGGSGDLTLLVSTDSMDDEGDVVEQNFEVSGQVPFLFAHKSRELPVGHITNLRVVRRGELPPDVQQGLSDDAERATLADVDIDEDDPFAAAVMRKYRRGDMEDSSVGFDPIEFEEFDADEPGRFHFLQQELKEISATPIGANSDTTVLRKEFDPEVIPEELLERSAGEEKEGRRNSKRDKMALTHAKQSIEVLLGERKAEEIGECPFAKGTHPDEEGEMSEEVDIEKGEGPYVIEQRLGDVHLRVAGESMQEAEALWEKHAGGPGQGESTSDEDGAEKDAGGTEETSDEAEDDDTESGYELVIEGERAGLIFEAPEEPGATSGDESEDGAILSELISL